MGDLILARIVKTDDTSNREFNERPPEVAPQTGQRLGICRKQFACGHRSYENIAARPPLNRNVWNSFV